MNATGHAGMGKRNAKKKKKPLQQYSQKRTPSHTYKKKKKATKWKCWDVGYMKWQTAKEKRKPKKKKHTLKKKKMEPKLLFW